MARFGWACSIVLIAFAVVRSAHAATVRVRYHVDARHYFETSPRATRSLLLQLYSSKPCVGPALKQEFVQVEAVPMAPSSPPTADEERGAAAGGAHAGDGCRVGDAAARAIPARDGPRREAGR